MQAPMATSDKIMTRFFAIGRDVYKPQACLGKGTLAQSYDDGNNFWEIPDREDYWGA